MGGLLFPAVCAVLLSAVPLAMSLDDSAGVPSRVAKWSELGFWSSLITVLSLSMALAFVPTTKTLCAIIAIPAIANNEQLQADASDIYRLGMERLKEELGAEVPVKQPEPQ